MKRKTLPLLALVATTLFLIACDDRSDDLKAISKFKDLTPPRFSDVVSHQDDVSEEWSQVDYLSGPTLQVLRTRQSPDGCEDGSYYYLVDMQEKTVQPLMNALCIADNIKLEYQEVTDPYTKEKYFEYSAAIFLIPICISFDTAEKRRYATYLILNRRFSFEF